MPSFPLRPLSLVIPARPSVSATRGSNLLLPASAATHSLLRTRCIILAERSRGQTRGLNLWQKGKNLVLGRINKAADQTQKSNMPSKVISTIQPVSRLVFSKFSALLLFFIESCNRHQYLATCFLLFSQSGREPVLPKL